MPENVEEKARDAGISEKEKMLAEEPVGSLLVKMTLPAMVGMVVFSLYNMVDTYFLGNFVSSQAIGALSIAYPIQTLAMALGILIGIGASSLISRALGRQDRESAARAVGNAFTMAMIIGVLTTGGGILFARELLFLFGSTGTLLPFGLDYLRTVLVGNLFTSVGLGGYYLILAEGDAGKGMISMFLGMGINILLDPLLIIGFKMGITGAALATVIGQGASCLYVVHYYLGRRSLLTLEKRHFRLHAPVSLEILKMGLAMFTRQVSQAVMFALINNQLNSLGGGGADVAISSYGIIHRVIALFITPIAGVSQGFQPVAGFNYSARKWDRVQGAIKYALLGATGVALLAFGVLMFFPGPLIGLFNKEGDLMSTAAPAMRTIILALPLLGVTLVGSSYFFAIGKARESILLSLFRQVIFFAPFLFLFTRLWDIQGVWRALPAADLLSALLAFLLMTLDLEKRKGLEPSCSAG